ncbi:MAG TPA: hypothetical protein VFO35_17520 [Steroidobacteraceae bacterium]|nr:hypothetical protein [Steroidobacteraceae bacterium]
MTKASLVLLAAFALTACSTNDFVASWRAPDAQQLEVQGAKVAAVVMVNNEASRRVAEDKLAREISARGAVGVPMYVLYPDAQPSNEPHARSALEQAGVLGIVVMRPVSIEKEVVSTHVTYASPVYRGYWGGYYGAGWGTPWGVADRGEIRTNTIVQVETLVYSLRQNKLVWGGQSQLTNPASIDRTIERLAASAADELHKQGLLR